MQSGHEVEGVAKMSNSSAFFALVSSVSLGLTACNGFGIDGNGERVDEIRETTAFSRIRSDCELDVQVIQGDQQSLTVSLDSNLQDLVETRVSGDTLYLDLKDEVDDIVDGPHVLVTLPELTAAKVAGSGSMTLELDEPTLPLDLFLSGSGSMRFDGKAAAVGAYLSGSGDLRVAGATSEVEMVLSGSGSIRGQHLDAESAAIELSGSGDVSATVRDSVSVSLSGSGQINLYGGATVDHYLDTGSGDIVQH
jgi:hypothetical protein